MVRRDAALTERRISMSKSVKKRSPVCTENSIRVDLVTELPTVSEPWSRCYASG